MVSEFLFQRNLSLKVYRSQINVCGTTQRFPFTVPVTLEPIQTRENFNVSGSFVKILILWYLIGFQRRIKNPHCVLLYRLLFMDNQQYLSNYTIHV